MSPTIGILGSGQLGRMLALAAARLGMKSGIYAPQSGPACSVAAFSVSAPYEDEAALARFARRVDVITFEFENVPVEAVRFLEGLGVVRPGGEALEATQDRRREKALLVDLGIKVAPFAAVETPQDLPFALRDVGVPAILKTCRFGYDGHGQERVETIAQGEAAVASLKTPLLVEGVVPFTRELSVILARTHQGVCCAYDVVENLHKGGILRESRVPARVSSEVARAAQDIATQIATALDYVGVMGVEFFTGDFGLLVNEIAPRVHNSGHWTLDACGVSQFEQHVRAICGWPLGESRRYADAVMTNLLGEDVHKPPEGILHLYGKAHPRPRRKMGHVTSLFPLRNSSRNSRV